MNVPAKGEAFSPHKRASSTSKHEILNTFALLDPDPDPLTWLNPDPIRIRNAGFEQD